MADEGIETFDLTEEAKEQATGPEGNEAAEIVEEWTEEMRWKATAESLTALQKRLEKMEREKASQWQIWEERLAWMESRHRESEDDREKLRRELEELREAVEKASKSPSSEATEEAEISKGKTPEPEVTPEPSAGERRRKVVWA